MYSWLSGLNSLALLNISIASLIFPNAIRVSPRNININNLFSSNPIMDLTLSTNHKNK